MNHSLVPTLMCKQCKNHSLIPTLMCKQCTGQKGTTADQVSKNSEQLSGK